MTDLHEPGLVDVGANLTNDDFADDLPAVLERARLAGVDAIVVTGTSVDSSTRASALAAAHPGFLLATAGVHPHGARLFDARARAEIESLSRAPCVVAIGECGLDYARDLSSRSAQLAAFEQQLDVAASTGLPAFLHERGAHEDFLSIMRSRRAGLSRAVVHCFTGTREELEAYLDLDLHIGVTGWITDRARGAHLAELLSIIPPDRLMIETDSPYLIPSTAPRGASVKIRGHRRNEPALLPYVARAVAAATGETPADVAIRTASTARAFFRRVD